MPTPRLAEEVLQLSVDAFALHGEKEAAAKSLGIAGTTLHHRLREAALRGILPTNERPQPKPSAYLPTGDQLPPKQIPTADIIAHRKRQFEQRRAYHAAKRWRRFTVPTRGPYALMFFGDPHLDDDGCNIPLFEQHAELAAETEHLYAINIGDTTNNWAGRLAKLWANQDASAETAKAMVRHYLGERGIPWFLWLHGNHDCLSMDHEVLTKRGWVLFDDLRDNDEVSGINPVNGYAEWQPIHATIDKVSNGTVEAKGTGFSVQCTVGHRFIGQKRNWRGAWEPLTFYKQSELPVVSQFEFSALRFL